MLGGFVREGLRLQRGETGAFRGGCGFKWARRDSSESFEASFLTDETSLEDLRPQTVETGAVWTI